MSDSIYLAILVNFFDEKTVITLMVGFHYFVALVNCLSN